MNDHVLTKITKFPENSRSIILLRITRILGHALSLKLEDVFFYFGKSMKKAGLIKMFNIFHGMGAANVW